MTDLHVLEERLVEDLVGVVERGAAVAQQEVASLRVDVVALQHGDVGADRLTLSVRFRVLDSNTTAQRFNHRVLHSNTTAQRFNHRGSHLLAH